MRIKLRSPKGSDVLTLQETSTVADLLDEIASKSSIPTSSLDLKFSYPPKTLDLTTPKKTTLLSELPFKLNGEQIIVSSSSSPNSGGGVVAASSSSSSTPRSSTPTVATSAPSTAFYNPASRNAPASANNFSFGGGSGTSSAATSSAPPLSLTRNQSSKVSKTDPPTVPLPSGRGMAVLRVMEDDNSCLFRALSYVLTRSEVSMEEMRQVVAGAIQGDQEKPEETRMYSEVTLEQKPDAYCEWIKMESSWGGAIELGILADFFGTQIIAIDVGSGSIYRFNESSNNIAIVAYSGIHYDAIALSQAGRSPLDPSGDEVVFDALDTEMVEAAQKLCQLLKGAGYYTDTQNFSVQCNVCKTKMKGEKEAVKHAAATGHMDFGEC